MIRQSEVSNALISRAQPVNPDERVSCLIAVRQILIGPWEL